MYLYLYLACIHLPQYVIHRTTCISHLTLIQPQYLPTCVLPRSCRRHQIRHPRIITLTPGRRVLDLFLLCQTRSMSMEVYTSVAQLQSTVITICTVSVAKHIYRSVSLVPVQTNVEILGLIDTGKLNYFRASVLRLL